MMAGDGGGDWQLSCGQVRERGARLLASGQWADCSFRPGAGQRAAPVKAHRLILAMASPVFQAMLYGPLAEGDAPIPVPDVQPDVFNKLLQYVYTDDVDLEKYEIAIEVYYAADKYMLPHLQVLCTKYLSDNLVPQNACGIYEFANCIEDEELEYKSLKIIQDNTKQALAPGSSFEDLALGTAIHIFSLDRLTIDSELDLLAAAECYVLEWLKYVYEKAELNISSSDVDSKKNSTSKIIDKDTSKVDIIKCNGNSNGDIENHDEKMSIDGLDDDEDEATAKNQEITLSDTKPLQPACSEYNKAIRSKAAFRFTVNSVSKMECRVSSPPFYIYNLPWNVVALPVYVEGQKYLGFYVQCNEGSKSVMWSCKARIEYRLVSHKPNIKPCHLNSGKFRCFSSSSTFRGCSKFMAWNAVLDPEKGYVKDDAITVEVHVIAEPPQGLFWHWDECIGDVGIDAESIRALLRPIRFLTLTEDQMSVYEPKLPLLTDQQIEAIIMNISSKKTKKPLPEGFSKSRIHRTSRKRRHDVDAPAQPTSGPARPRECGTHSRRSPLAHAQSCTA